MTQQSGTSVKLSGLQANTDYDFRVRALYADGNYSSFTTLRVITDNVPLSLPYTDGFENGMGGWRLIGAHADNSKISSYAAYTGEYGFQIYQSLYVDQTLVSPCLDSGNGELAVSFKYSRSGGANLPVGYYMGYSKTTRDLSAFSWSEMLLSDDSNWATFSGTFPAGTKYIAIQVESLSDILYLDDFIFYDPLMITLADNADNTSIIKNNNGRGANVTLSGRTLYKDEAWNTLCLPFDVTTTSGPLAGDGVTAMTLNTTTSGLNGSTLTLNFTKATNIPAGTPFIIKWDGDGTSNLVNSVFTGVIINNCAWTEIYFPGGSFVGTYSPVSFTANDKSILFLGAENKLYYPSANMTLGSCRAYFQLDNGSGVKEFKLNFDGEDSADGIGEIQNSKFKIQNEGSWYSLDGRMLSGKPTQEGIYIIRYSDGTSKKVLLK